MSNFRGQHATHAGEKLVDKMLEECIPKNLNTTRSGSSLFKFITPVGGTFEPSSFPLANKMSFAAVQQNESDEFELYKSALISIEEQHLLQRDSFIV